MTKNKSFFCEILIIDFFVCLAAAQNFAHSARCGSDILILACDSVCAVGKSDCALWAMKGTRSPVSMRENRPSSVKGIFYP